ncbi:MAG: repressor LexA [Candidatus Taylorbacteria bacterium RIFCSPHIGHO2_02_FULL_45_28]|uniref:Repressor LexA n=1 Tax=Candidatus Taylorbacteria bacterium RIFCSPHIGHO2_12_FULL_45_16 TaxID=1802315 RepID=A0A1G2MYR2_9BACT|nr:MAG: repressor LexA [Candidatus Taylorbacteria bacterium RIFCSPHIGHO2_01_FULL_44_110]OHA25093.1 MAG: repressor LexA [Candidatus Taylorbacteria bacterium RIFCSPHIGHO2_02_FULL_45_28]OHA28974.1 MAG: repressor LexA [Candidatus Taylorbacteria bacterium RIFCSPHIGHO2_12_FULL_45_16]OHA33092.1 MAG: repressor LexA [Candidatus Taylorbacteria bacterium RIFCSPLOWO2_01_FULL_45_59]OHA39419.1 MAG: repressor LexA [Candidatus Taylorbacteria bacterium RIFCSPLOWO2_02_FULL_45_10b]OHA44188.1 MAG: repressor LexA 
MSDSYKNKIISFYKRTKRMPSYAEIMTLVGFKSKNAVYKLVNKLVGEGVLDKDSSGRLIPNKLVGEIPMLGLVEAGFPMVAEETILDTISIDEYLINDKDKTYLLEVKGDSMIEAGIQEGDLVVAERKSDPKDGDIVIAEVDGGWTMKYFRRKGTQVFLEPANKKYKPIYPEYDIKVAAVVTGVVRKY